MGSQVSWSRLGGLWKEANVSQIIGLTSAFQKAKKLSK